MLGDNDWACEDVVLQELSGSGQMVQSYPMQSECFDVIRLELEGSCQKMPEQTDHYFHYNT